MTSAATTGIPKYSPHDMVIVYSANVYGAEIIRFFKNYAAAEAYCHFALADGVTIQYHAEPDALILNKVVAAHGALKKDTYGRSQPIPDFVTHSRNAVTGELVPR